MSNLGGYQDFSIMAKRNGGPENYLSMIEKNSFKRGKMIGRLSMVPLIVVPMIYICYLYKKKDTDLKVETDEAKTKVIQSIKDDKNEKNDDEKESEMKGEENDE